MNGELIAVAAIAFACGIWLGWLRASAERRSLEEWVNVLRVENITARLLLKRWLRSVGAVDTALASQTRKYLDAGRRDDRS